METKRVATIATQFGEIRVSASLPGRGTLLSPAVTLHEVYKPTVGEVAEGRGTVLVLYPDEARQLLVALTTIAPELGIVSLDRTVDEVAEEAETPSP